MPHGKWDPGTVPLWYKEICDVLPFENSCYMHRDNNQPFVDIWKPLLNHLWVECSFIVSEIVLF